MSHPILGPITLIISDVGTSTPTAHAASHEEGGADELNLTLAQVVGAGTMAAQSAAAVNITGGALAGVTISSEAATLTGGSISGMTITSSAAILTGGSIDGIAIGQSVAANASFLDMGCEDIDVTGTLEVHGGVAFDVPLNITSGGTGADNDADARNNLGIGTMGVQAKTNVDIEGGTIDNTPVGSTTAASGRFTTGTFTGNVTVAGTLAVTGAVTLTVALPVASGGTGAQNQADARSNLGLVIGTNVQAYDADLAAIAGLTSAADRLPYYTGSGAAALATFTSTGRSVVAVANVGALRTLLVTKELQDATYTLTAGAVTVVDANITSNSVVIPIPTSAGSGTPGHLSVALNPGVGFDINSTEPTDDRILTTLIAY